jgi:tripartite-type tricarboxylate transporter receptor subunit TctC
MKTIVKSIIVAGLLIAPLAAAAQEDYPKRPITIVVPYPPGAVSDAVPRLMQSKMAEVLGQPIVIENRPGAGGVTGLAAVARAEPNGYTLALTVNAPAVMAPYLQRNVPYNPATDLTPVAKLADTYLTLSVQADSPIKSVNDVIRLAKEKPGTLTFGSAGIGSAHQIAGELLNKKAGIEVTHIPFQGGAPAITDLAGGHLDMSYGTLPAVHALVQSGKLRIVAFAEPKRVASHPDIPTINETIPGVETSTWLGVFAPKGTPKPIVDKVHAAIKAAMEDPGVKAQIETLGLAPALASPEEFQQIIVNDLKFWKDAIETAGIPKQ